MEGFLVEDCWEEKGIEVKERHGHSLATKEHLEEVVDLGNFP